MPKSISVPQEAAHRLQAAAATSCFPHLDLGRAPLVSSVPKYTVAIPAHNEAQLLPHLLTSIDLARERFAGGEAAVEVVVGDNGSTDETARIAHDRGCHVVTVERRSIAAARNGAAMAGRGAVLCFIDADSVVHPETFNEIETIMATGRCAVGASGVRMERMSWGIGATFALMVPLTRLARVDTGVVFCRRGDFLAVGGYREHLMVAEDVDFMTRLKRHGRNRGARFVRLPTARAITSTRKFDRHGDWHYFPLVWKIAMRSLISRKAMREQRWAYWYDER